MTQKQSISDYTNNDSVNNVAIFIADSLRSDALPNNVADCGINMQAVAPSTYTASSIPSTLSGIYPMTHKVWNFEQQLTCEPFLFREIDNSGFCADTIWTHLDPKRKPPIRMLKTTPGKPITTIEEPFIYVEHDKGGHTPYGNSFDECESASSYYRDCVNKADDVRRDYKRGIHRTAERFFTFLNHLEDRSLLDETLVIFTSDHGELLGEPNYGGVYGHGQPMTPKLIEVPLVFCGAGLPNKEIATPRISNIDVAPTVLSAQDRSVPNHLQGADLWTTPLQEAILKRPLRSDVWHRVSVRGRRITTYAATSAWDHHGNGGIVFQDSSTPTRVAHAHYHHYQAAPHASLMRSEWDPQQYLAFSLMYARSRHRYESSSTSLRFDELPTDFTDRPETDSDIDPYTREQLSKLGYT